MKHYLIVVIAFLLSLIVAGQTDSQPVRIELESKPNTEPFMLVPMAGHGLLLSLKTNEFEDRNSRIWGFGHYDTIFGLQWEFTVPLLRYQEYAASFHNEQQVSLMFYDSRASAESNLQILTINTASKQYHLVDGNIDKRFEPYRFTRQGNHCYVGVNSKNACKVYRIDIKSGDSIELELNSEGGNFIENINVNDKTQEIIVITSSRNERRRNALCLHRFNSEGNEQSFTQLIKNDSRKMITSAEYVPLNEGSYMVLGSFTSQPQRRASGVTDAEGSRSTGFYNVLVGLDGNNPQVQFHNFSDLTNLENYIRGTIAERRQRSLRRWFQRSQAASFEHYLVMHEVLKANDAFLLAGEAFTPDFRTVTTIAYDYYGRPVPRSYSVFDGYRYSHGVVVAFDSQGQLKWDNGIEMINIRTFDLFPRLVLHNDVDGLALAYNHEGKIAWKLLQEDTTITNISYANIETSYSKDRVNSEQSSRLIKWYGNYFLASGYQTITNNYLPSQNKRNVFYVNKIAFD
ncbi:MAG: hypothetical protein IH597_01225 [Bacteroidales bacterium]|nr:hypothetical protein [Bacteroidales bacterium]